MGEREEEREREINTSPGIPRIGQMAAKLKKKLFWFIELLPYMRFHFHTIAFRGYLTSSKSKTTGRKCFSPCHSQLVVVGPITTSLEKILEIIILINSHDEQHFHPA